MSNQQPASPPRCLQCHEALTFARWFSEDCKANTGKRGVIGHEPSIPGVLLPLTLESEVKDATLQRQVQ